MIEIALLAGSLFSLAVVIWLLDIIRAIREIVQEEKIKRMSSVEKVKEQL